jgi:tRNA-dihydrouridine synthase
MIGRTAPSNPWIFRQIEQHTAGMGEPALARTAEGGCSHVDHDYDEPSEDDRYQMIRTYFQMLIEEEMPGAEGKMKQFASWFTHGVAGGAALRKAIYESKNRVEILSSVEGFFEERIGTCGRGRPAREVLSSIP